jgi:hypothetical protein
MNTLCIRGCLFILLFFVCEGIQAQRDFVTLGESELAINSSVTDGYKMNFGLRTRYFLYRDSNFQLKTRQIDIVHFSTFRLDYNHDLSIGIQYRNRTIFDDSPNELRITEQLNYTKQGYGLRYGHRFRTEQRILPTKTIFRQRYRFAIDLPLNGEKLDIGEAYFVSSMELLLSLSRLDRPEIDHRTTAQIGWQISKDLKLQTGLEYRFEAFNISTEYRLFILTSAIIKI